MSPTDVVTANRCPCCCHPQAALRRALHATDPRERGAAEHLISSYCHHNFEGQLTLLSSMAPTPDGVGAGQQGGIGKPNTFGGDLAAALVMGPSGIEGLQVSGR